MSTKKKLITARWVTYVLALLLTACVYQGGKKESSHHSQYSQLKGWTETLTIPELHQKLTSRELTAVELTQFYLQQIEQKDSELNSIIMINPDALKIAAQLDLEAEQGKFRSELHGIPIVIKDNIETRDMPTTAGSLALKDNFTGRDATLIKGLRDAGAIILAKANLSEWANIRSERSSSGWSAIGGQTHNPHDTSRSTCGSSSGSGAAVAANLAVAAVGTETDGSITCPAAMTGVVGFKPTVGVVSRFGIVPISVTQDTAGAMTKHVIDAAVLLKYMSSEDSQDSATVDLRAAQDLSISTEKLDKSRSIPQYKLGLMHSSATAHEAVAAIEKKLVKQLSAHQVKLVQDLKTEPYPEFWADSYNVLLFELKHTLNEYLAALPTEANQLTLEKLIEFNHQHKDQEMKYFQQEIFEKAEKKGGLESKEYQEALRRVRKETQSTLKSMINDNELDAMIAITRAPAWKIDRINGDHFNGGISSYAAIAGYPHITIPLDDVFGLPIGISVMGLHNHDQKVLEIAASLERFIRDSYSK